jgi:sugar lactone lactonase YvrE
MTTELTTTLEAAAELGESPIWNQRTGELVWVDIVAGHIHFFEPSTGNDRIIEVGQPVGAVGLRRSGGLVLAVRDGFALLGPSDERPRLVAAVEMENAAHRMNDGACDARGRFWAGTMQFDSGGPTGSLYRLDPDGAVDRMLTGVTTSNGIDWSLDGRTMYYIDSATRGVDAFAFEVESGAISARKRVVEVEGGVGVPDGLTVDSDGFLWVALWGGGQVRRYAPDGRLALTVNLPVSQVTSCAFGGPDLRTLYVTSACTGLDAAALRKEPLAGSVFAIQTDVVGCYPGEFGG